MWQQTVDYIDLEVKELAPGILSEWLEPGSAASLMNYLWTTFLDGRPPADDEMGSVEDYLRFLSMADVVADVLEYAESFSDENAWDRIDMPYGVIPHIALGFLLAKRGIDLWPEHSVDENVESLVASYRSEVRNGLATHLGDSDFFCAVWGARLGIECFPVSIEDMEKHDYYMDSVTTEKGMTLELISNMWPST